MQRQPPRVPPLRHCSKWFKPLASIPSDIGTNEPLTGLRRRGKTEHLSAALRVERSWFFRKAGMQMDHVEGVRPFASTLKDVSLIASADRRLGKSRRCELKWRTFFRILR